MRSPAPAFDLRAALTEQLGHALQHLEETGPDAVHGCRVALKKARALVRAGAAGSPGLANLFQDAARAVMHALAPARDLAAQTEAAVEAAAAERDVRRALALAGLAERLTARCAAEQIEDIDSVRAGLKDLMALAHVWPECSDARLRRGARKLARRARRARRRGVGSTARARRHVWRRREKDRLYAAELLGETWPGKRRQRLAGRLAEALGREYDIHLLLQRLKSETALAGDEKARLRAVKALKRRRAHFAACADALGEELRARRA